MVGFGRRVEAETALDREIYAQFFQAAKHRDFGRRCWMAKNLQHVRVRLIRNVL
jgi:hypothetical protein